MLPFYVFYYHKSMLCNNTVPFCETSRQKHFTKLKESKNPWLVLLNLNEISHLQKMSRAVAVKNETNKKTQDFVWH